MSELSSYIRREMNQRGITQRELGEIVGLPKSTINDLLTEPDKDPPLRYLRRIADGLGLDFDLMLILSGYPRRDATDQAELMRRAISGLTEDQIRFMAEMSPGAKAAIIEGARRVLEGNHNGVQK